MRSVMKKVTINLSLFLTLFLVPSVSANLEKAYSSDLNDYNFNISSKYDRAVFARSEKNFANAKVWQVLRQKDGKFSHPEQLNLGPAQYKYSDPMLTADGQTLTFISNRPLTDSDKTEDYNIWQAELLDGTWSKIEPLPYPVNTDADELGPEIHNGILYYASSTKGYLSIYQARQYDANYQVSEYTPLSTEGTSRSDLTFSPDGNIALFWQHSAEKNDTHLMMQRKMNQKWSKPEKMPPAAQSPAYEFTPQFSPDGQWLYFASGKDNNGFKGLNIHKISSKELFPASWYQSHLVANELSLLAPQAVMDNITSFSYDFSLNIQGRDSTQHMAFEFEPFKVCKLSDKQKLWTDGTQGVDMNTNRQLNSQEIENLMRSVRLNFIYMLKQPNTRFYPQYASTQNHGRLYRVESQGINNFTVLLDNNNSEIAELRYDDQSLGLEKDYKRIKGINWPMKFEYWVDNAPYATGHFSNLRFNQSGACDRLLN